MKKYKIELSKNQEYIIITVEGNINNFTAMEFTLKANSLGKELGVYKYLVDLRKSQHTGSILDKHEFVYHGVKEIGHIDKSTKVAMLVDKNDHSHDLIEKSFQNNGILVTLFRDRAKALTYLGQGFKTTDGVQITIGIKNF